MNTPAIEINNVRKSYRFFALDDVSLRLEQGQIMGFVGPNGAGKTTTIRMLMAMIQQDAGEIRVLGHAMPQEQARAKRDIGFVSDDMSLFGGATLAWHMGFVKSIYAGWDEAYAKTLLKRFHLRPEQHVKGLSHGERTKAALLARARAPAATADPRRADVGPRPRRASRGARGVHGGSQGRRALDPVLLAQHARRRADLRPDHVHRSRPHRRLERQGSVPRPLAPAVARRRPRATRLHEPPASPKITRTGHTAVVTTNAYSAERCTRSTSRPARPFATCSA